MKATSKLSPSLRTYLQKSYRAQQSLQRYKSYTILQIQKMQISKQTQESNNLALPSSAQASFYIFHAYYQKTISKIRLFLQQFCINLSKTPIKQKKKYSSLTNEQISQRGYFLHYIYQCIISLHQIQKYYPAIYHPSSQRPFKKFINDLILNIDDLAKLTRIKRNYKTQGMNYHQINKQIIEMLYQTEIYAYQILIRIIQVKIVYEQQVNYRKEVEQISKRYIFADCFANQKIICSKKQKMVMKRLFHQMQSIFLYYHCEVSINRTECNSKLEFNCLLHLLKNKFSKPLLSYVLQGFNFRCQGQLIVPYILPLSNIQQQPSQVPNPQMDQKQPNLNGNHSEIINQYSQQLYVQQKSHLSQSIKSINDKQSKKQSAQSQSNPSQIILTIKQENQQEIAIYTSKKEEDSKVIKQSKMKIIEKEKKSIEASDDDYVQSKVKHLKYERTDQFQDKNHQKFKPSKHSSKNMSLKQKMKVLGHNQRFAHTLCNIKYVMTSKSSKKDLKRQKQQQNGFKLSTMVSNGPIIHFNKQKDNSQESFLAEETPIHRQRNFINKS